MATNIETAVTFATEKDKLVKELKELEANIFKDESNIDFDSMPKRDPLVTQIAELKVKILDCVNKEAGVDLEEF